MWIYIIFDVWSMCRLYELYWRWLYIYSPYSMAPYGSYRENFPYYLYGPIGFIWSELIRGRAQGNAFFHLCKQCGRACAVALHSNGGHVWSAIVFFCAVFLSCALNTRQLSPRHPWVNSSRPLLTHMIGCLCVWSDFMRVLVCECRVYSS